MTAPTILPPWLASCSTTTTTTVRPPSPSVTLSLSTSTTPPAPAIPWLQPDRGPNIVSHGHGPSILPSLGIAPAAGENQMAFELLDCSQELEQVHRVLAAHQKETAWRLKRMELQLESEKACRRREKMEDVEAKIRALKEEQKAALDYIEAEYREQLAGLRREAEAKEQKLADQWAAKHFRLTNFLKQMGGGSIVEPHGR